MTTVTIKLTKAELWELMSNFEASFDDGSEENETARRVSKKLNEAYEKF